MLIAFRKTPLAVAVKVLRKITVSVINIISTDKDIQERRRGGGGEGGGEKEPKLKVTRHA